MFLLDNIAEPVLSISSCFSVLFFVFAFTFLLFTFLGSSVGFYYLLSFPGHCICTVYSSLCKLVQVVFPLHHKCLPGRSLFLPLSAHILHSAAEY